MALETGVTYIEDMVSTNPVDADDFVSEGDDHLRLIKFAVQGSFPSLGADAVTKTALEINQTVDDIASPITTEYVDYYGAVGDGVTNDYQAIVSAQASGSKKIIFTPGKTYLVGSNVVVSADTTFEITGATILKGFSGDLFTISGVSRVGFVGGKIDGQYGSYIGKCFVLSGVTDLPVFDNVETIGFTDSHYEFGADAGKKAKISKCAGRVAGGQGTLGRMVHFNGPDTGSMQRAFDSCVFDGYVDSDGAQATFFSSCAITYFTTDSATSIFSYIGGMLGNSGLAQSIDGDNLSLHGFRASSAITLEPGSNGSFVGVTFTSGGLTDNSTPGGAWFTAYRAPNANDYTFNLSLLNVSASVPERIQTSRVVSTGDADTNFDPATSAPVFWYAQTLTANRVVTLSTTNATNGTRLRVTRTAGGNFDLDVGTVPLKTLVADEWCDVEYNGSVYILTGYGTL